ncbi:hypothetical protein NUW58_g1460 [Xylaria curta]|uniref:Uncharacterized protein n=1 Tax=Xylaria curta TaxID=42375 RepID=A0ACC1PN29_9PEZI|nr:hypothetical protein NUW58_g1460 [Xylaria curta]
MTSRPVASSGPVSYEPDVIRAARTLLFMANTGTNSHNHHRTIPKHLSLDIDIADENLLEYDSEGVESRSTKSTRTTYSLESSQVIPENTPEELTMNSSGRRARQSVATGRDAEGRDSIPTMPSTPQKNSYQRPSRTPSSRSARRGVRRRESMSDLPPEPSMKPSEGLKQQRAKVTDNTCRIATDVESLYNEWMEKAGGDHNKAAGFWFEKQEQKSQSLWPTLEKCEAFVEAMKKDGRMRRRMVVEEDEVGEYHPAQKPKLTPNDKHPQRSVRVTC